MLEANVCPRLPALRPVRHRAGYHFACEDLIRFFAERGHSVRVILDQPMTSYAGNYLRLLIT
jgi:hypothetical protein